MFGYDIEVNKQKTLGLNLVLVNKQKMTNLAKATVRLLGNVWGNPHSFQVTGI